MGGNWSLCCLKNGLEKNTLNFPDTTLLPGRNYPLPYVCTGDDAYPLTVYMMKPYPQKNLSLEKCMFNQQLSRIRCISVNAFGILANCWSIQKAVSPRTEKVKAITLAVLTLHNWLRKESNTGKVYFSPTLDDPEDPETGEIIEEFWRKEIPTESWKSLSNTRARNPDIKAKHIREEFTDYFTNEGCISWQWKCIKIDI